MRVLNNTINTIPLNLGNRSLYQSDDFGQNPCALWSNAMVTNFYQPNIDGFSLSDNITNTSRSISRDIIIANNTFDGKWQCILNAMNYVNISSDFVNVTNFSYQAPTSMFNYSLVVIPNNQSTALCRYRPTAINCTQYIGYGSNVANNIFVEGTQTNSLLSLKNLKTSTTYNICVNLTAPYNDIKNGSTLVATEQTSYCTNIFDLENLSNNTLYYLNITSCTSAGVCNVTNTSFRTLQTQPPVLQSISASPSSSYANIFYVSNVSTNATINYGLNKSLGTPVYDGSFGLSDTIGLSPLNTNTTYWYNITLCNPYNQCVQNGSFNFTTQESYTPTYGSCNAQEHSLWVVLILTLIVGMVYYS